MYTVTDLRRAMVEETEDLAPRVTFDEVRALARRRRLRWVATSVVAALLPLMAGFLVNVAQPAGPPRPTPGIQVDKSDSAVGDVILTGASVGDKEELAVWFTDTWAMVAGLYDKTTGKVRSLEVSVDPLPAWGGSRGTALPRSYPPVPIDPSIYAGGPTGPPSEGGFARLAQIDDRHGGMIDYGLFIGDVTRITLEVPGHPATKVQFARWSKNRAFTVFWVRHKGTLLAPTQPASSPGPAQPRFVAYGAAGKVVTTSDGHQSTRTDGGLNSMDRSQVGDQIRTGLPTASGGELVIWFVGDDRTAIIKTGARNKDTGVVTELVVLSNVMLPPRPVGFYFGVNRVEGPGGRKIALGVYVGPATRLTASAPDKATTTGSGRWSTHPEVSVVWVADVPDALVARVSAVAYDAQGNILEATKLVNR